jgi:RHH-type proline utilization regulon transcriptional repressor/proline dehydrogenase/delta 1-pyrroline-5-carboxylate dehydrogenase
MRGATAGPFIARAKALLAGVSQAHLSEELLVRTSVELAALLLEAARQEEQRPERARRALLERLMQDPTGQAFTTLLTDRVFRDRRPDAAVDAARQLIRRLGVPQYLPALARAQMIALLRFGPFVPELAAKGLFAKLHDEVGAVVLSAQDPALSGYLGKRRAQGVRVNLNQLGEAVLGEREAQARVAEYITWLARPDVDAISVKVSSVFSQIDVTAFEPTLETLSARLRAIFSAALAHRFEDAQGRARPKLVSLDMEAYRDVELTVEAFKRALDVDALLPLTAGIALQAYLPDSARFLRELTAWSQARRARGGAPIRVRLVKGANLLAERIEAAQRGLEVPVFASKAEVDASYKKLLTYACEPDHAAAVQLGIASHNVFDIALGLVLRRAQGVEAHVGFELLEGMAAPLERALHALSGALDDESSLLVYAPVVAPSSMQTAIAYLMRRLDESTAEENFLRKSAGMRAGDESFAAEGERFASALRARNSMREEPRREQDRARAQPETNAAFRNEPDTDFSQPANRAWLVRALESARAEAEQGLLVCSQVAGERRQEGKRVAGVDPSRPGVAPYAIALAEPVDVARALDTAERAGPRLASVAIDARAALLHAVARELRAARGALIGAMVLDAGKRAEQADVEVSEAIDFADYYAESFAELARAHPQLALCPRGIGLVTPPWNFPLAIPAGGVLALLMSGHPVVLKPSLETPLVALRLCEALWRAGVERDALQLVVCEDAVGETLVRDARVGRVVLTGSSETARLFQRMRPELQLIAETGGKNAIIVTARADRDAAIVDVIASAFGHSGQKCSACSLLIAEGAVLDDPSFLKALRDAAASLPVGSAWDTRSVVTPLMQESEALARALDTLEPNERWLLAPERGADNPRLVAPGIKLGVAEGSFMHQTELFGPVLAVMRAEDLEHALRLANATPYGLTAGLHSLDEREHARFAQHMRAGNLYINRGITGAIVRRQPFGGFKASSFGPGAKAGGPNYVLQLCEVEERAVPEVSTPPHADAAELITAVRKHLSVRQRERVSVGACDYGRAHATFIGLEHDPSAVLGERNVLRYVPCAPLVVRAGEGAEIEDIVLALVAARTIGAQLALSVAPRRASAWPWLLQLKGLAATAEPAAALAERLPALAADRVRCVGEREPEVIEACRMLGVTAIARPVLLSGRVELLAYVREQSVTTRVHRFGNLAGERLSASSTPSTR